MGSAASTSSSSRRSPSTAPSTPTRRCGWGAAPPKRPTATNAARGERPDVLVRALLAGKFEGWNGTISFSRGEGPYGQQWTPPMLLVQYTKPEQAFTEAKIVFPPEFKTGDLTAAPKR